MSTTEFERLQMLMQTEEMSAKDFAAEVGIAPSTMSNILNGRNKPSLDVMQRVLNRFRLISPEWLILGVGTMYKSKQAGQEQTLFDIKPEESIQVVAASNVDDEKTDLTNRRPIGTTRGNDNNVLQIETGKKIERNVVKVIVFFDDGSFQEISK